MKYYENVGWKREVPEPYKAHAGDVDPASVGRERIELEEDLQDQGELRMFDLFAEAVEDLYTGTVDKYVRNKPALWEEFAQRLSTGHMYLVDPDRNAPIPTVPTEKNICLDIHNNLKFSPRFCLWAVERKLTQTHETLARGTFAEFVYKELKEYVDSRSHLQDDFCKHLVINKQTRTFEDPNYVNTIGSKVVIRPLAETWELSVEEDQLSQRRMVQPTDPAEASNDVPGDSHQVRYQNHQMQLLLETDHQVREQKEQMMLLGTYHQVRCQRQMMMQKDLNTYHQVRDQELKQKRKRMWKCSKMKNNNKKKFHKILWMYLTMHLTMEQKALMMNIQRQSQYDDREWRALQWQDFSTTF